MARQAIHFTGLNCAGSILPGDLRRIATPLLLGGGTQQ
jgi:hypothetical protein